MKFSVAKTIFEKFLGVEIGVIVVTGMDNQGHSEDILQLLRAEEKHQKEILTGIELGSLPEIAIWRKIYKDFGSGGKDYRSSVEALLRRSRGGEKPLPQINNLVDLYNYLSIKYHLPAGAEDIEKAVGDIELTVAKGDEKGKYIGGREEDTCYQGEVIYRDQAGFICRRWNWREGDRTKIDKDSKNAVLVIEKAPGVDDENFKQALEEGAEAIKKYLKGQVQTFILNQVSPSCEANFQTGSKAKITKELSVTTASKPSNKPQKHLKEKSSSFLDALYQDKTSLAYKLRQIIYQTVKEALSDATIKFEDVNIEHPTNENYGDYSTNLAMKLAGRLRMKPFDIANLLGNKLSEYIRMHHTISALADSKQSSEGKLTVSNILDKVTAVLPGFVNLTIKTDYLITLINQLLKSEGIAITTHLKGKKIAVEYTDPNPFKEFHLGHLYSNVIGEAISRMFEASGARVWRGNFYGDAGMHVAKSVWGMIRKLKDQGSNIEDLEKLSLGDRQRFLGEGYALGVNKYDEDPKIAQEIKEINLLVYVAAQEMLKRTKGWRPIVNYRQYIKGMENRLSEVAKVYEAGLRWSLEYFETIYKRLGTKFDGYYPESWVGEYGMKLVDKGLSSGVLEKSDGSVIFRGEKEGLHTRVFVNKLGLPTYEAKDLGLAFAKYQDFKYDASINVFGKEIDEYYKVVKAAMIRIEPELGEKANYIAHGMVKLPKGKMSSRTGTVLTFEWLIEEVKKQVLKIMKDADLSDSEKRQVAEFVGLGAIRYALLRGSWNNDVIFDIDKSVSLEGDSGPYLQYTFVRCKSVMRKSGLTSPLSKLLKSLRLPREINAEELALLRSLYRFPEVVAESARTFSPSEICSFLYDLAQKYNLFYNKHSILTPDKNHQKTENKEQIIAFRLFLTEVTATILKKGLYLLGIETVERM